jgi:putative nucleotidyltransferase with HDIG domain
MLKRIAVRQLQPGMYIADLGSEWLAHPFLRNSFAVKDETTIARIAAAGIHQVYIDPARGLDVDDAPTHAEVHRQLTEDMLRAASTPPPQRHHSAQEEAGKARIIHAEANQIIHHVMQDVRLGRQVRLEQVEPVVERVTESILRNGGALLSLCRVKNKDDYTFQHSVSVCALLVSFCRAMEMDAGTIRLAGIGGLLHDIGKVKVPAEILGKPGRLSEGEFKVMQCHVVAGREILERTEGIAETSIQVAYEHHERHDGSGYPLGLKGEAISQMGRMAAICDVYDAITSDRCYHRGLAPHEALRRIFEWSTFHFDPRLVHQFLRTIGIYPIGTLVMLESGRIGIVIDQAEGNLLQPTVKLIYDSRRRCYIEPEVADLARPLGHGGADKVVGHETPDKWGIDIKRFV